MDQDQQQLHSHQSPIIKVDSAHSFESRRSADAKAESIDLKPLEADGRECIKGTGTGNGNASNKSNETNESSSSSSNNNNNQDVQGRARVREQTHAYGTRWLVLAIFCAHSAINSFQWIQYSSITNIVTAYYGVSNLEVNFTSLVYMITYIPFIIHASLMLERVGLRRAICLGAAGTALGSLVKLTLGGAPNSSAFWGMMAGQTIVALSQLYIISIPPLLAAVWFPDHQVSTATGIGVFGNQLGIALGFIVPPLLVSGSRASSVQLGAELHSLSLAVALLSGAIFLLALVYLADKPPKPPGSASLHAAEQQQQQQQQQLTRQVGNTDASPQRESRAESDAADTFKSIRELSADRDFRLLTLSYGINVGVFYAVSTVLNQMVARSWPNPDDLAGTMGLLIVVSGMAGSVMCGQLLDRTHAFKLIIVLIYLLSLISMMLFTLVLRLLSSAWPLYLAATTLGFFMTGYLPLGFEFAAEITYPHPANTPAGLLNLSAQVFGLALTYSSSLIVDKESGDLWANLFLTACLAVGLLLTAVMRADLRRQKAVAEELTKC